MKQPATLPTLRRQGAALTVLALAVVLAALAGLCFGSQGYTPLQLWQAWCSGDPQNAVYRVLLHVRWPRTLAGLLAGSALAAAGVLLQAERSEMAVVSVYSVRQGYALAGRSWRWEKQVNAFHSRPALKGRTSPLYRRRNRAYDSHLSDNGR